MNKLKELVLKLDFMTEHRYQILMYIVTGGFTTFVNLFVFWFCESVAGTNYQVANVIAWFFAVAFAYITNKLYVFESKTTSTKLLLKEIVDFFSVRVLTLLLEMACLYVFIDLMGMSTMVGKIIASVFVLVSNYVFSKLFVFSTKNK